MLGRELSTWVKVEVKSHPAEEQDPTRLGGGQTGTRIKAVSEDTSRVVGPKWAGDRV